VTAKPQGTPLQLEIADASGAPIPADDKVAILVAHQVAVETASLNDEVKTLKTENASLKDQLDVAEAAKAAAVKEFEDYKAEQAAAAERASLVEARTAEVAKVAPALEATEDRVQRWTSMDKASFDNYLAELAAVAGTPSQSAPTAPFDATTGETAMSNVRTASTTGGTSATRALLLPA
jgi:FtsZ-binding cell division protein ZapB